VKLQVKPQVFTCTFEEILPIWRNQLWPGRQSAIEPVSIIDPEGRLTLKPGELEPVFFQVWDERNEIIGVNSGFRTSANLFRSRGIWVKPEYRRQGIGLILMHAVENHARSCGCKVLWSMPRESAFGFYRRLGFEVTGGTDTYEFGPHFLAQKKINGTTPAASPNA
jgi:GNAT superfamily N-acetyltransferase